MCVPSTIATGISVLGSALSTANALSGQKAQAEHAKQQREQAFQNAKLAEDNARKALLEGEKEKEKIRLEQKALQSKKAVEYGAGNIDLAGGSPLAVLSDMAVKAKNTLKTQVNMHGRKRKITTPKRKGMSGRRGVKAVPILLQPLKPFFPDLILRLRRYKKQISSAVPIIFRTKGR